MAHSLGISEGSKVRILPVSPRVHYLPRMILSLNDGGKDRSSNQSLRVKPWPGGNINRKELPDAQEQAQEV